MSVDSNDGFASPHHDDLRQAVDALGKMAASWPHRAAVKKDELDVEAMYDESLPGFLEELLPFSDHPEFAGAPEHLKQKALSCGWLAYNEKTIAIETRIISPACVHVLQAEVPGVTFEVCKEAMAQTFVDEAYHTLLLVNANRVTRQRRGLEALRIPDFSLIRNMAEAQEMQADRWKKILIQVICATVSEISISDYLRLLSGATTIQPLNMLTTEIHRRDEMAHTSLFKKIGHMLFDALSDKDREFVVAQLAPPMAWFSSLELDVWRSMLEQIGFPRADRIIGDCAARRNYDLTRRDFSAVAEMASMLGIDANVLNRM